MYTVSARVSNKYGGSISYPPQSFEEHPTEQEVRKIREACMESYQQTVHPRGQRETKCDIKIGKVA